MKYLTENERNQLKIVYIQTQTVCNGHCRYCPFDDIYGSGQRNATMSETDFLSILDQLRQWQYEGRIGLFLHFEPTLDHRLPHFVDLIREKLPLSIIEVATNGTNPEAPILKCADLIKIVPPGSLKSATSRAGNVRSCPEISSREKLKEQPCVIPRETMCFAANGDVLLCCQDWRHEAVVGNLKDLNAARIRQLELTPKFKVKLSTETPTHRELLDLKTEFFHQICLDCDVGLTAEEVGHRLGKRIAI